MALDLFKTRPARKAVARRSNDDPRRSFLAAVLMQVRDGEQAGVLGDRGV